MSPCHHHHARDHAREREKFKVYIIPKLANGSDEPIPRLFTGDKNKQVILPNNTPYAIGLTSDFDLPAEATIHIDNKNIGVFYLKPYGSLHLKRSANENKGFVFISCNSPEAKFLKYDKLSLRHLGQVRVTIRPMDRAAASIRNPLAQFKCLNFPENGPPVKNGKSNSTRLPDLSENPETKNNESEKLCSEPNDDDSEEEDLKYTDIVINKSVLQNKSASKKGLKVETDSSGTNNNNNNNNNDNNNKDENDGIFNNLNMGFTAFGHETDQRFFKVHRVPTKGRHEFEFYLKSGDININKSRVECCNCCSPKHVMMES